MRGSIFLDTNILIYIFDKDIKKKSIAKNFLKEIPTISIQVCNEISNILLKKYSFRETDVRDVLNKIVYHSIVKEINLDDINLALDLKERYRYSYYDSLIIASALNANCSILYSEDLQHNQQIFDKLKIVNPFKL